MTRETHDAGEIVSALYRDHLRWMAHMEHALVRVASTDFPQIYEQYAAQIGVDVKELSTKDRQQAVLNAILEETEEA